MKNLTTRKIVGTLVVALVLSVGIFGTAKASEAFFLGAGNTLIFDGTVSSVGSDSVTLYTTGTDPITVETTRRTVFTGGGSLSSLQPGDNVKVIARRSGSDITGTVIQEVGGVSGYGTAGDIVLVSRGTVTAKTANTFTVRVNNADVTFHVTGATRFFGGSFASVHVGERVVAFGRDTGSSATGFVAHQVFH